MGFNNTNNNIFRQQKLVNSASNYAVLADDVIINITNTSTPRSVTLPAPNSTNIGKFFSIKDASGAATINNITITPVSGTIDGSPNYTIDKNYGSVIFYSNGTNYFIQTKAEGVSPALVSFRSAKNATQAILPSVEVAITNYQAPDFNIGSAFNNTTGVFTAPRAGRYAFSGAILLNDAWGQNQQFIIGFSVNGALSTTREMVNFGINSTGNVPINSSNFQVFDLAQNNTVRLAVIQNTGVSLNIQADANFNYFMGFELQS